MGQQAIVWALAILIGANLQISNASAEEGSVTETATKSLELGDKGVEPLPISWTRLRA